MRRNLFGFLDKYTELVFFLGLVVITICCSGGSFCYDEPYYYQNVELLNKYGFSVSFFSNMYGPAGPLHSLVFWSLQRVTGNSVIGVRLVNIIFLFAIILCLKSIYNNIYQNSETVERGWSLGLMSIPMTYVCAGLALTEISALLMLTLSLYFLVNYRSRHTNRDLICSAVLLSLAIIGRQPYLLLLPLFVVYVFMERIDNRRIWRAFQFLVVAILLPSSLFVIWKGIVPNVGGDVANAGGVVIQHVFLGLGYLGFITVLLDRKYFINLKRVHLSVWIGGVVIISYFVVVLNFKFILMASLMDKLLSPVFVNFIGYLNAVVLVVFGLWFLMSLLKDAFINKENYLHLFIVFSILFIILSCVKVSHQFSSRYVFQAATFILLLIRPNQKDRLQYFLSICGGFLGFLSLHFYLIKS